jgi:hypothetical protein
MIARSSSAKGAMSCFVTRVAASATGGLTRPYPHRRPSAPALLLLAFLLVSLLSSIFGAERKWSTISTTRNKAIRRPLTRHTPPLHLVPHNSPRRRRPVYFDADIVSTRPVHSGRRESRPISFRSGNLLVPMLPNTNGTKRSRRAPRCPYRFADNNLPRRRGWPRWARGD